MEKQTEAFLMEIAKNNIPNNDPSHDFQHTLRVLKMAKFIASKEGGDLEIIIPAALFHDIICYPKDDPRSKLSTKESADFCRRILSDLPDYPTEKIEKACKAILECSFSKGIISGFIEGQILQEADRLEATGTISIMRTFSSTGQMGRQFYHPDDPFCENREPNGKEYALDLFYQRLLIVKDQMYTKTGKDIAKRRTRVLDRFLEDFRAELTESLIL